MKAVYEAKVISHGGRNGAILSSDGILNMKVSTPKEMGGAGGATNPEQLFAAGYAACFENAVLYVARAQKINTGRTAVTATVGIGTNDKGGFQLAVKLEVSLPEVPEEQARAIIEKAHTVCPYSNATRGNIEVDLQLVEHA